MNFVLDCLHITYGYYMAAVSKRHRSSDPLTSAREHLHEEQRSPLVPALSIEDAKRKIDSLKSELQDRDTELEKCQERERETRRMVSTLKSQLEDRDTELEKHRERESALESEVRDVATRRKEERESFKTHVAQLESHVQQQQSHARQLEHALSLAHRQLRDASVLLETRSAELREAQAYLTKVDDVPDREVQRILENLNSRIFQTAASASDAFQGRYRTARGADADQACSELERSSLLSPKLVVAIRSVNHEGDSVLVQTALQAAMVAYTKWLCATWDFRLEDRQSLLEHIYRLIRKCEPQSVAGRWRAMARVHVKQLLPGEVECQTIATDALAEHITNILVACGTTGVPQELLEEVKSAFSDALHEITGLALEFQRVTGERIVSRECFAVVGQNGDMFDPDRMNDEWASPKRTRGAVKPHPVLCTTHLGLVREENRMVSTDGADGRWETSSTILLKPKVVLTSMLEELWDEQAETGAPERASTEQDHPLIEDHIMD
ncbi:hypothetical protein L226DRAFT_539128 [Lentinus tigrinus ALCF2SS1-7]|uniref:Uncharacterized protein n=1 Tax=Lentinus tigrinus ALCF2SS1-6 TaxID=1328759 RepID=A0A5C2RWD6_9APHY|nr:hypothetical protein L227DRAFT_579832 [Lentinus tigrinus ALCF2SS1-6]RPD70093.1 hypothetical protein L226DRAFT_539128 [Lentinus tigrinus ALCF2SS1-7]